jgi:cytoskeletal protein CcmA (bactofilin family)
MTCGVEGNKSAQKTYTHGMIMLNCLVADAVEVREVLRIVGSVMAQPKVKGVRRPP